MQAFQKYYWSLTVWDKNDKKVQSDRPASFEMGMMELETGRTRGSPTAEISTKKKAPTLGKNLKSKEDKKSEGVHRQLQGSSSCI